MKSISLAILGAHVFAAAAQGSLLYSFSVEAADGIQAFSFSFRAPQFLTSGGVPSFDPFDVTDGTHTWTMALGVLGIVQSDAGTDGCYSFATANGRVSECAGFLDTVGGAEILLETSGLPQTTGTFALIRAAGGFSIAPNNTIFFGSNGILEVTGTAEAPEPCSTVVPGIALAMAARKRRRSAI